MESGVGGMGEDAMKKMIHFLHVVIITFAIGAVLGGCGYKADPTYPASLQKSAETDSSK